ncbi:putative extracellular protein [Phytophthora megakarya]|uniref:Putative extracellular protein n=1 Tax=Phytophthora megakarya TaxID=4795 RepID=A0A225VGD8_9STRA|nr:putative extracellular protein [Phytophthora megakarya]
MEMELPATPTPTDSRGLHLNFQSPTADKAQQSLRMQVAAHNFKKRAACDSPVASDGSGSPLPVATCNFAALSRHFHLPLKVAAEKFGVRATAFKKRCRAIGIRHWPYRKVRSLKRSLQELEQCLQQAQEGSGPPLSDKQMRQFAGYQSQLKRLLSPETYGIDPFGQALPANFFQGDADGGDDHDSDEDSCGSQSPRPGVEHFVHRNKARKHLFTDSPSSASASSPHRENLFFINPAAMNAEFSRAAQYNQYSQAGMIPQPGFVFDTMYDPFGELSTSTMDPYGDNDHPSCGYSLDAVSYDFFPLQPSPTMAMRKAAVMAHQTATASTSNPDEPPSIASNGLEGLEDDIFRHISPEYGCLV